MSFCVPDFEMDEDYSFPTSSTLPRSINSPIRADEEIMELVWENGQIVMQSHNQRPPLLNKRPPLIGGEDGGVAPAAERREIRSESTITDDQLFMQEDEMAFWLHHYPTDLYSDEIDPVASIQELRISPPSQPRRSDAECSDRIQNFVHFLRPKARTDQGPSILNKAVKESTVVDSCETGAYEMTSSSGDSERVQKKPSPTAEERKRKGREGDTSEWAGEDVEFESPDAKKQNCSPTYAKKSRAFEVHNLSERRRRDTINEKMRALQELIPHCNKSDKASLLDEAIEYLKSLQLQVQMMCMGYGMVPMMFPGVQQYMPPMGMAMGMGTSGLMLPFPSVLASSTLPTPAAAAHMGPRLPVPAFHMPSVPLPRPSNQSDPVLKSLGPQNLNQPRMMNFPGPYPQYVGLHHTQLPMPHPESSNGAAKCQSAEYQQGG